MLKISDGMRGSEPLDVASKESPSQAPLGLAPNKFGEIFLPWSSIGLRAGNNSRKKGRFFSLVGLKLAIEREEGHRMIIPETLSVATFLSLSVARLTISLVLCA